MSKRTLVTLNARTARLGDWRDVDAVVFVHGIAGHFHDTWGTFPDLLASAPDLPDLNILLWGYRTGFLPKKVHGTETLAHNLVSELRVRLRADTAAFLVAHSMGGLIVFQGLVEEMRCGRAREHPTSSICFISLFAVPTKGSSAADVAAAVADRLGLPEGTVNDQIRSLGGQACDSLMAEVAERIYNPPADSPSARRIPIRMVIASSDAAIDHEDSDLALTPFQNPPALALDYGHQDLKLPTSHEDVRYLTLAHDVQAVVAERFVDTCERENRTQETIRGATSSTFHRCRRPTRRRAEPLRGLSPLGDAGLLVARATAVRRGKPRCHHAAARWISASCYLTTHRMSAAGRIARRYGETGSSSSIHGCTTRSTALPGAMRSGPKI